MTSGKKSLGFVLSDEGYDVWLGNFRGNFYGRRHFCLDPDLDKDFWKWGLKVVFILTLTEVFLDSRSTSTLTMT